MRACLPACLSFCMLLIFSWRLLRPLHFNTPRFCKRLRSSPSGAMGIDLKLLSMAILRGPYPKTETVPLSTLYKDKPVVLYAIRRMG